ncbi:DUF296 domain-containing protein [Candidatus Bipolaricaulota bacterium]|nr:DUF296 domain-containing protein [Candidatus Bipolaricaulota bacterium]
MILVEDTLRSRFARMMDGESFIEQLTSLPLDPTPDPDAAVVASGVGMLRDVHIGYWTGDRYKETIFCEPLELLSVQGNIGHDGTKRVVHCHVTLAREDGSVVGGHLLSATVHNTVELHVIPLPGVRMARRREPTGLMALYPENP